MLDHGVEDLLVGGRCEIELLVEGLAFADGLRRCDPGVGEQLDVVTKVIVSLLPDLGWLGLPAALLTGLGFGLVNGALALALTTWPAYARQARSEIQRLRHSDYLAAAEMLEKKALPLIYRVHDEPSQEKVHNLQEFLKTLDLPFTKQGALRPAQFNRVLAQVAGVPVIGLRALRFHALTGYSLPHAVRSAAKVGSMRVGSSIRI